jgi:hypothetical protein
MSRLLHRMSRHLEAYIFSPSERPGSPAGICGSTMAKMMSMVSLPPSSVRPLSLLSGCLLLALFFLHSGWSMDAVGGGFHPGHVWAVDQVAAMMSGSESWSGWTTRIGFPEPVYLRLIGWAPLLLAAPLSWVIGAPGAMWVVIAVAFVLAGLCSTALIHRVTGASWAVSAGSSLIYVLGPFSLGVLANGQLAKMQLWCLPVLLLAVDRWLSEGPTSRRGVCVFGATVALGFTSPSVGLVVPVAVGCWVLFRSPWRAGGVSRATLVLVLVAVGLAVPWLMHTVEITGTAGLLPAAPVPGLRSPPALSPVTTLSSLFWAEGPWGGARLAINNVAGLGIPAVVAAAGAAFLVRRQAGLGLSLFAIGSVLSMGPTTLAFGYKWILPATLLEMAHYPLTESGMYYRFVQLAALGLAISAAQLAHRLPKGSAWVALAIGLLTVGDGIRETRVLWPRSLAAIPHQDLYKQMEASPEPGAVLELPLSHLDTEGERRLLGQLIHRRPTTVLARNMVVMGQPRLERLARMLAGRDPAKELSQAGFRYILLHSPSSNRSEYESLVSVFGPSLGERGLGVWVVPSSQEGG